MSMEGQKALRLYQNILICVPEVFGTTWVFVINNIFILGELSLYESVI